jgi:GH24 family phage-related lysozyme (muramidase)
MPTVPIYQRDQRLRPAFQQGIDVRASAESFGAATGRGLQSLGQGLGQVGNAIAAVRAKDDETRAKEGAIRRAQWDSQQLYNPETGLMNRRGSDAIDAYKEYEEAARKFDAENARDMSPAARQAYVESANQRTTQAQQTLMINEAGERKRWYAETQAAQASVFANDALANYNNDELVRRNIAAGLVTLRQAADDGGWAQDKFTFEAERYESGVRKNVILRMAEDNPLAAQGYYEQNKDRHTGEDQFAIERALRTGVQGARARNNAERIISGTSGVASTADAASLLRHKEGFRSDAYPDYTIRNGVRVNSGYRAGYGSDTVTKADGSIVKVTPSTVVSRADAERDLTRRIGEFQQGISRTVGSATWNSLPANVQSALTSVAYNYGRLPFSVANAVVGGDTESIAKAIEGLGSHNGGINRTRRNTEAAMARGAASPTASATEAMNAPAQDFMAIERELAAIEDPDEREATRKLVYGQLDARDRAMRQAERGAQTELYRMIEQDGSSPMDAPLDLRLAAGQAGMASALSYWQTKQARGQPVTDDQVLYDQRLLAAQDPQSFARQNLLEYRNMLDDSAFNELSKRQADIISGKRMDDPGQVDYSAAFSLAGRQLEAIGLTTTGQKNPEEVAGRIARFNNALIEEIAGFQQREQRKPDTLELQRMINNMLLPIVISEPGSLWGTNKRDAFAFEAQTRADGSTVNLKIDYGAIPIDLRQGISTDLAAELGRVPTREEVVARYVEFMGLGAGE